MLTTKSGVIQCGVTDSTNTVFVQHTVQLNIIGKLLGYTQQQYLSLVAGVYPAAVFVTCCWQLGYTQQQYFSLVAGVYPAAVFASLVAGVYPAAKNCHMMP